MSTRPSAAHADVADPAAAQFARAVRESLNRRPPELPTRYLYNALGSALFDAICQMPWYAPTRAELGLLAAHAGSIFSAGPPLARLVELGSGNGDKLVRLLASGRRHSADLELHLIDVSQLALDRARRALGGFAGTTVLTYRADYERGLDTVTRDRNGGRTLALFLGSNIGNFDPPQAQALLRRIRAALDQGDLFLIGVDLVKPERELLLAYDDPLGITAAFNRNLLTRLNEELDADADVGAFRHRAAWNREASRMEMCLVSTRTQTLHVPVAGVGLPLREGDVILTERSYKYRPDQVVEMLEANGFARHHQWIDHAAGFALTLVDAR
jgi:L-histidine Nalpha-methyltransferase